MLTETWSKVGGHGVVDTAACWDPDKAIERYAGRTMVVVIRESIAVWRSLNKKGLRVEYDFVDDQKVRLERAAHKYSLPVFHYDDLLGSAYDIHKAALFCSALHEEFDYVRWENQMQVHVEHDYNWYLKVPLTKYKEWANAPEVCRPDSQAAISA